VGAVGAGAAYERRNRKAMDDLKRKRELEKSSVVR
jgi:hypothetical protein